MFHQWNSKVQWAGQTQGTSQLPQGLLVPLQSKSSQSRTLCKGKQIGKAFHTISHPLETAWSGPQAPIDGNSESWDTSSGIIPELWQSLAKIWSQLRLQALLAGSTNVNLGSNLFSSHQIHVNSKFLAYMENTQKLTVQILLYFGSF